jgi:hypothetical protein
MSGLFIMKNIYCFLFILYDYEKQTERLPYCRKYNGDTMLCLEKEIELIRTKKILKMSLKK